MADNEDPSASSPAGATRAKKPTVRRGIQRQSKAERDEYNRKEAEKAKERAAQDGASGKKATRGGPASRARGGARSNTRTATSSTGDGFTLSGGGHTAKKADQVGTLEELDGGGSTGQDAKNVETSTGVTEMLESTEPTTSGKRAGRAAAKKDPSDVYAHIEYEQDDPSRRNIEHIWISSGEDDSEEDPIKRHKGKQRQESRGTRSLGGGLRPVRAPRIRREEEQQDEKANRAAGVKTTRIARTNDSTAIIDVDADDAQIDEPVLKKDPPSSPELSKKVARRSSSKYSRDAKILSETIEDRAERLRLVEDVRKLKGEFLRHDTYESMDVDDGEGRERKMFLFQLPPLIPALSDPLNPPADIVQAAIDELSAGTNTDPSNPVKTEPGLATTEQQKAAVEKAKITAEERRKFTADKVESEERLMGGMVGKLNVHRSGRVSLDWGGVDMEVRWGSEVDFLQDVVVVEDGEPVVEGEHGEEEKKKLGKAYALGQVRKKMVVIPDWSKLYT